MARGSIIWRCRKCGNKTKGTCKCPAAKYSIAYWVGDNQKWEAVSRLKKEAEHRLVEVLRDISTGSYQRPQKVTFRAFSERWLRKHEGKVKPLTYRSYNGLINLHLNPAFGELLLTQIRLSDIEEYVSKCRIEKKLSARTINYTLTLLTMILEYACDDGLLRTNPARKIDRQKREHREMDCLNADEIKLLLKYAEEPYRTIFLTAALTGMRRGELLALQWGDIDWRRNAIFVRRSLYWKLSTEVDPKEADEVLWTFSSPKTETSIRSINLSPKLREALQIHRINCSTSPHDLVFCTKQGTPFHPDSLVKNHFNTTLDNASLRKVAFHSLRHSFVALLIAQGEHVKYIQSQVGHASIQTTMDQYGHLLPHAHQNVGEKLDSQLFEAAPKQHPLPQSSVA